MTTTIKILISVIALLHLPLITFPQSIAINEVMASNATTIADEDGDYEDWLELYNYGDVAINLGGYGLSDNYDNPFKWVFPSVTIASGEYMLIWTSGKNRAVPGNPLHTNFSIGTEGEEITLTEPSGILIDELTPTSIPTDYSYGKFPNGTGGWRYFTSATPGAANVGPGYGFLLSPLQLSHPEGIYLNAIDIEISSPDVGTQIYYTLDGSEPDENAIPYEGAITLSSRIGEPNDISMIPTNNNNDPGPPYYEGWQPPLGEVFKINVLRARAFHEDAPPSRVSTGSYLIDSDGINRYTLPFFSISTHRDNLFDDEIGIYVHGNYTNYFQDGIEWERPANISFFESDGTFGLNEDVGIRLHGNTTRSRPRKSIRVCSRAEYGNSWMNYQLFPDKPVNEFKRFILRNSGNDWDWAVFRDAFIQYLAKDLHVETQYYRPSIVFINGEYWGIHNVRDRYDEHYIFSHYGIEEDEMTIMENNSEYKFGNPAGVNHYNNMLSYLESNDISQNTHFEAIKTMIDVESFIDFELTHIFAMNTDWPGNNSLFWRFMGDDYDPNAPVGRDGRWRWMILDTDFGFGLPFFYVPGVDEGPAHNTLAMATEENGPSWPNPSWSTFMLRRLLTNQSFKNQFINRYCDLLNTTFSSEHVISVIDSISGLLEPEMQEHINRWRRPPSMNEWHDNVDVMRSFAQLRTDYQRQHVKQKFGLSSEAYVTLNVSNEIYGHIRINSIDIKSSTMGVPNHPYPWVGYYFKGIPIELEAIPSPGYQFSHWEGASSSSNALITITPLTDIELKAHFLKSDDPQLIHYWFFGTSLPNDTPLETINATHSLLNGSHIEYHSALAGYPFTEGDPNWRKASMERRNSPTNINYRPEGNNNITFANANMRGIQIKQPFTGDGGENTMVFNAPTKGFEGIVFRFAAKDEGAADNLTVDYSISIGEPQWITTGLETTSHNLLSEYQLFEVDFSEIDEVNNNSNLKIRIRFEGEDMAVDQGNRVTFNNFSIDGVSLTAYTITSTSGSHGTIVPHGNISVYEGDDQSFTITPDGDYAIEDLHINGNSVLNNLEIDENGIAVYDFTNVTSNQTIHATFYSLTHVPVNENAAEISIYPNPTSGMLRVVGTSSIQRVEIVSLLGRLVYCETTNSKELTLNLSSLSDGLYIALLSTEKGFVAKKIKISK
jgi:hypothetical protein